MHMTGRFLKIIWTKFPELVMLFVNTAIRINELVPIRRSLILCFAYIRMFALCLLPRCWVDLSILYCFVRLVISFPWKFMFCVRNCQLSSFRLVPRPFDNQKDWCLEWIYCRCKVRANWFLITRWHAQIFRYFDCFTDALARRWTIYKYISLHENYFWGIST